MINLEVDKKSKKEMDDFFKRAAELPRKRLAHAAKEGGLFLKKKVKENLPSGKHKMTFKDGNTYTTDSIATNLVVRAEKGKRLNKRVVQVKVADWKVALYALFVEFGYTRLSGRVRKGASKENTGNFVQGEHHMRNAITKNVNQLQQIMMEDLAESLSVLEGKK